MMRSSGKTGLTGIAGMSLALICGIPFSSVASAQWAVDADGNWTDTANWTGGIVPAANGDAVLGTIITDNRTVTLDSNVQLNSLTFNNTLNAGDYFLVPSTSQTLTLTGDAAIDVTGRHWIKAELAGTAGINISGAGELVLDADNSFSGGLNVDATNLAVLNTDAIPAGNDITAINGAQIRFWGTDNAWFAGQGATGFGTMTFADNISVDATSYVTVNDGSNITFTGTISGDGEFQASNSLGNYNYTDVTFTTANTYAGATRLWDTTMTITGTGTLGTSNGTQASGTFLSFESQLVLDNVNLGNEYLFLDENADGERAKIASSGNSAISGNIYASEYDDGSHYEFSSAAGGTLTLSGTISAYDGAAPNDRYMVFSGDGDFSVSKITDAIVDTDGNYLDVSTGANVHVVKRGSGTLTITTATDNLNDYWEAGTVVEGGTLVVQSDGSNAGELRSADIQVLSGATLDISSFSNYSLQVTEDPDGTAFNGDEIGQTLSGTGTINVGSGTIFAYEDAVFAPGVDGAGTLSISGKLSINQSQANPNGGLNFDLSGSAAGDNDLLAVSNSLDLDAGGGGTFKLNVTLTGDTLDTSPYTIMTAGSTAGSSASSGSFDIAIFNEQGTQLDTRQDDSASVSINANSVTVQFSAVESMNWTGSVDNTWDIGTTGNWNSSDSLFYDLDSVNFSGTNTVDIPASVTPSGLTISSGSTTFTGDGAIQGKADLAIAAGASATLGNNGVNAFADISIGAGSTLNASLVSGELQVNGDLSGSGTLNVTSSAVVLNGDNSGFTGSMTISDASVVPNTATALSGTVTANSNATIGVYGQTWTNSTAMTLNGGTLRVGGGDASAVSFTGNINVGANGATIQVDGGVGADGATVNNVLIGANAMTANVGANSALNVTGTVSGSGTLTVSDTGSMVMADGSALTVSNINVTNGSLDVSAMNAGAGLTLASGQVLNNDSENTVTGNISAGTGSTISGHGTFANNITVQSGANLQIGLDGMSSFIANKGLLDDFDSYSTGNTNTATGSVWNEEVVVSGLSSIVASDQGNSLQTLGGSAWSGAERDLTGTAAAVEVGQTQAFFWQVMPSDDSGAYTAPANFYDFMMGLSTSVDQINTTDAWSDFAVMPFVDNAAATPYVAALDGNAPWWTALATEEWCNIWVIVDNDATSPSYDVYVALSSDPNNPVLFAENAYWRGGDNTEGNPITPGTALNAIGFMAAGAANSNLLIDNIWYSEDPADFLTNPLVDAWTGNIAAYENETLTVEGDLVLSAGATVSFDIATDGINDLLNVTGTLTAGGTLEVTLDASISALAEGDTYDILDFASATGSFATLNLPTLDAGLSWDTSNLLVTGIIEVIAGGQLDGDLNGDGFVGLADLDIVLTRWNQNVTAGDWTQGDPSGDGFVGLDDLDFVLINWNNGTPPSSNAAIPEPASLALLGLGGMALLKRRG